MINLFLASLKFLTILPISNKKQEVDYKIMIFFPTVAFIIGSLCYFVFVMLNKILDLKVSVFFILSFYIIISDFFHLDGFVDTIDALFSFKKDKLQILKDPHIGAVGAIYLVLIIFTKYILLVNAKNIGICILLLPVYSKTALCIIGFFGKKMHNEGIGKNFLYSDFKVLILSLVSSVAICLLVLKKVYLIFGLFLINFFVSFLLSKYFSYKLKGINGDVFGFVNEILEVVFLFIFNLSFMESLL